MISQVPDAGRMSLFLQDNSPVHEFPTIETEESVTNPATIRTAVEMRRCDHVKLPAFSPDLNCSLWLMLDILEIVNLKHNSIEFLLL